MKNFLIKALLVFVSVFLLSSCGANDEEKTYDDAFLKDFTKGLTDRWDLNDKPNNETENIYFSKLVDTELNRISQYTDKKFDDTQLQEKAITYINLLKAQKEALTYYNTDYSKYNDLWEKSYAERAKLITSLINEYNLKFPQKYNDILNEFTNTAKTATEKDEFEQKVNQMVDNIKFEMVKSSYGYNYYEAIVENITDKEFENFSVDIKLLDTDGVIIDTAYAYTQNLSPAQKAKLEFSTDKKFDRYELKADYYVK